MIAFWFKGVQELSDFIFKKSITKCLLLITVPILFFMSDDGSIRELYNFNNKTSRYATASASANQ